MTARELAAAEAAQVLSRYLERIDHTATAIYGTVILCGPFQAQLNPYFHTIWLNYAVPVDSLADATAVTAGLRDVRRVFAEHGCVPHFAFHESLWPALPAILEDAGLELCAREPLMVCTPEGFQPVAAPDVTVRFLTAADGASVLKTVLAITREGFDERQPPTAREMTWLHNELARGESRLALAHLGTTPAGVGRLSSFDGAGELTGIATAHPHRCRGVASTLSSALTCAHFECGGTVAYLFATDAGAQAVYQRIGFRVVDTLLHYMAPAS